MVLVCDGFIANGQRDRVYSSLESLQAVSAILLRCLVASTGCGVFRSLAMGCVSAAAVRANDCLARSKVSRLGEPKGVFRKPCWVKVLSDLEPIE